jgi:hypothetical protein
LRYWVNVCTALLIVCLGLGTTRAFAAGQQDPTLAVAEAKNALGDAFKAVSQAEDSGANVSGLMGRMNEADAALEEARAALAAGNYSDAVSFASECDALSVNVSHDAGKLESEAIAAAAKWWMTVSFSVAGSAASLIVLLTVWRRFKRHYFGQVLGSTPEVLG